MLAWLGVRVLLAAGAVGPGAGLLVEEPASPGDEASAPVVVAAPDGAFLLAWESAADGVRDIRFQRREGGGGWLPAPVRLDTDAPGASRSLEPRLAVGALGHVFAAWQDDRHGDSSLYFNRSTDGGRTWGEADVRVGSVPPGRSTASMPALAADGLGRVYLAWEDLRDGDRDIRLARSTDAGATWEPDRRVCSDVPGSAASFHPQIASWDDGTVLVLWWDERAGLADLYVRRSREAGASWEEPERRLDPGEAGETPSGEARLVVSADSVVVAWEEGFAGATELLMRCSPDRGASWGDAEPGGAGLAGGAIAGRLLPPGDVRSLTAAAAPGGAALLAWIRMDSGSPRLEAAFLAPAEQAAHEGSQQEERQEQHHRDQQR